MNETQFFHYKCSPTILHGIPSWIKILLMLILAGLSFYVPLHAGFCIWFMIILFEFFLLHFSLKEIATDLKTSITYFTMMYCASFLMNLIACTNAKEPVSVHAVLHILIPNVTYSLLFMHLGLSMQITSIFYRTTSTIQFNEGLSIIERTVTRRQVTPFADIVSLTITFIPRLTMFWQQIENAWKARGGKERITKIVTLSPTLFRISMHEAYLKALARQNRTGYNFSTKSEVYICDAPHVENLTTK
ncbi:MAG: hypothetical protein IJ828_02115 [Treponema sp.]|nr:hypothetical protein [Treponema sp.]